MAPMLKRSPGSSWASVNAWPLSRVSADQRRTMVALRPADDQAMKRPDAAGTQPQGATRPGADRTLGRAEPDDLPVAGGPADAEGQWSGGGRGGRRRQGAAGHVFFGRLAADPRSEGRCGCRPRRPIRGLAGAVQWSGEMTLNPLRHLAYAHGRVNGRGGTCTIPRRWRKNGWISVRVLSIIR